MKFSNSTDWNRYHSPYVFRIFRNLLIVFRFCQYFAILISGESDDSGENGNSCESGNSGDYGTSDISTESSKSGISNDSQESGDSDVV